jgi:hypothetical protein
MSNDPAGWTAAAADPEGLATRLARVVAFCGAGL